MPRQALRRPPAAHTFRPRPVPTRAPSPMETAAIGTFLLIGGFIWGGLVVILATAIHKERRKEASE